MVNPLRNAAHATLERSQNQQQQVVGAQKLSRVLGGFVPTCRKLIGKALIDPRQPGLTHHIRNAMLLLREINKDSRRFVDEHFTPPVLPIIENLSNSALSFKDMFQGPGLAIKKLYRVLPTASQKIVKAMFASVENSVIADLFSATKFPNLSRDAKINAVAQSISIGDFEGTARGVSDEKTSELPTLALYELTHSDNQNSKIWLLGKVDLESLEIFSGLVCVQRGNPLERIFCSAENKKLKTGEAFNHDYLLRDSFVTDVVYRRDGTKQWEWQNVTLTDNGEITDGSTGTLIEYADDGTKDVEYQNVTFAGDGEITDGCTGTKIKYEDGTKYKEWQNVTFDSDGEITEGSAGTLIENDFGTKYEYQNVTFTDNGEITDGCTGTRIEYAEDGTKYKEWQNVTFNTEGAITDGSAGTVIQYREDGTEYQEWQNVTFTNGVITDGSTGTRIEYRKDGTKEFEWQNVTFTQRRITDGSTGTLIRYRADGSKEVEWQDVTFTSDGKVKTEYQTENSSKRSATDNAEDSEVADSKRSRSA